MVLAALVVSIISAVAAYSGLVYVRRSTRASEQSADGSVRSADAADRSAELTPRFRITFEPGGEGGLRLVIFLSGPPELERLDGLTVVIRDDHPWRGQGTPLAGGPTPEQVAKQIWGLYRFVPGTGPGAHPARGIPGADPTARTTPTGGLPLPFTLEPNGPPPWSGWDRQGWRRAVGPLLRLRLESYRDGWDPWILPCEVNTDESVGFTEVPGQT